MPSIVEVIIKYQTQNGAEPAKAKKEVEGIGDAVGKTNISFSKLRSGALLAIAAIYLAARGIETMVNRLKDLGDNRSSSALDKLGKAFQGLGDQLLTLKIGGLSIGDVLPPIFDALTQAIKFVGIAIELDIGAFNLLTLAVERQVGAVQEALGIQTKWTQAWYDAADAQERATIKERTNEIQLGTLTDRIKEQNAALNKYIPTIAKVSEKSQNSLRGQIALQKELNRQMERGLEDAVRAGDANAYFDAANGSGSGGASRTGGGGRATGNIKGKLGPATTATQGATVVNVFIAGKEVKKSVREVLKDDVFKPTIKKQTSFPGKDQ